MGVINFADYTNEIQSGLNPTLENAHCSIATVEQALKMMNITLKRDVLLQRDYIEGLPRQYSAGQASNILPVIVADFLKAQKVHGVTSQKVCDCLMCVADAHRYNPVEEFLTCMSWDGTDRLGDLYAILGIDDPKYMLYVKKWLMQCVALGLNNEVDPIGAEGVLTLCGPQGCGKTSVFRILTPFPIWFTEGVSLDVTNKDSELAALSGWITELGELDSTLRREQSSLKAFLTKSTDTIRTPYARTASRSPRRTSFCATVNNPQFLLDETGSRRFWVVPITQILKPALFSLAEGDGRNWVYQLWFQIYWEYQKDRKGFRLTDTEMAQLQSDNQSYETPVRFQEEVESLLDFNLPADRWGWCTAVEIARLIPTSNADTRQVGRAISSVISQHHLAESNTTKCSRRVSGIKQYLLPLRK